MNDQINQNIIQEDEIDLKELFSTIWENKFKIIIFTTIVTVLTIFYTLTKPNSYTSQTLLAPQEKSSAPSLGGLASLAGIAGINLGDSSMDVASNLEATIKDYAFNKEVIKKYSLDQKLSVSSMRENMVFALGFGGLFDLFNNTESKDEKLDKEDIYFNTYKAIQGIVSLSSDKKTGLITLSVTTQDRFLSKELVDIYLKELTQNVKQREMKEVDQKIKYYKQELANTYDIELKKQISTLLSGLVQKKVLSQANQFYNVSKVTEPIVSHVQDKSKPKRGLIVVVSFITSIILGIFGVFFLEFLRNNKEEKPL